MRTREPAAAPWPLRWWQRPAAWWTMVRERLALAAPDDEEMEPSFRLKTLRFVVGFMAVSGLLSALFTAAQLFAAGPLGEAVRQHPLQLGLRAVGIALLVPTFFALRARRRRGLLTVLAIFGVGLVQAIVMLARYPSARFSIGFSVALLVLAASVWDEVDQ